MSSLWLVLQGHPEWKKLKWGWPQYIDEMDQMFLGVAVDGSTSFVPGFNATAPIPVDDEGEDGDEVPTPVSNPSQKRASSTSTTASSPNKKSKSLAVKSMNTFMDHNIRLQAERNEMLRTHLMTEKNERRENIRLVQQFARECGVDEKNTELWIAVYKITCSDGLMDFFLGTTDEARMSFIKAAADGKV